jgi:hypothetical protein
MTAGAGTVRDAAGRAQACPGGQGDEAAAGNAGGGPGVDHDAADLAALQRDFGDYRIWRSRLYADGPPGEWMATRLGDLPGFDPTIMTATAALLRRALASQISSNSSGGTSGVIGAETGSEGGAAGCPLDGSIG